MSKTYRIKPLVWERKDLQVNADFELYQAQSPFGTYEARRMRNSVAWALGAAGYLVASLSAAKLAAEAHYEQRMREGLIEVTNQESEV